MLKIIKSSNNEIEIVARNLTQIFSHFACARSHPRCDLIFFPLFLCYNSLHLRVYSLSLYLYIYYYICDLIPWAPHSMLFGIYRLLRSFPLVSSVCSTVCQRMNRVVNWHDNATANSNNIAEEGEYWVLNEKKRQRSTQTHKNKWKKKWQHYRRTSQQNG